MTTAQDTRRDAPKPPPTQAETAVAAWNLNHPAGTPVRIWGPSRTGPGLATVTRSAAWILAGQAVVCVTDWPGAIPLTHTLPEPRSLQQLVQAAIDNPGRYVDRGHYATEPTAEDPGGVRWEEPGSAWRAAAVIAALIRDGQLPGTRPVTS
jgi:hypothetical protein